LLFGAVTDFSFFNKTLTMTARRPAVNRTLRTGGPAAAGLAVDPLYDLDIFFAERRTTASNFNITTTLRLAPPSGVPEPGSIALLAAAIGAAGMLRRRRTRVE
jgi:PEP-CTERM motif